MGFPAVNDIVEVTLNQRKAGQELMNVFHYKCTVTPSTGTLRGNLFSLGQFLWAVDVGLLSQLLTPCMPDDWTMQSYRAQVISPARTAYVEELLIDSGDIAANQLETANLAWVIVKQTDLAGRRGRGDTHFLLPASNWMDNGELAAEGGGARTDLRDALSTHIVVPSGGEYDPVIYHPGFSPSSSVITHCTIKNQVRVMRRRTVGLGI